MKYFVSYLAHDVSNTSNIEIDHFDIYDPRKWKNLDNIAWV